MRRADPIGRWVDNFFDSAQARQREPWWHEIGWRATKYLVPTDEAPDPFVPLQGFILMYGMNPYAQST